MNATLLQSAITIGFILVGNGFRSLINFSVVVAWAFYFLTVRSVGNEGCVKLIVYQVLGLVILRVKEPMLERFFVLLLSVFFSG